MKVIEKSIGEVFPYENNPRNNESAVDAVANSIKEFGWQQPIVVDKNNVIIAGHTRWEAAQRLGLKKVPVVVADKLTDQQVKAFRLADNKTGELATWDMQALDEELHDLLDFDMEEFGFDALEDDDEEGENPYSKEVKIPHYEPTGKVVDASDLVDKSKTDMLIDEILEADIDAETKDFLIEAAHRHSVFNYRNIAEFYANASAEVQRLMERSALVIIDIDDAIANGYVKLNKDLQDIREEDEEDD